MSESKFKTMRHIETVRNYLDAVVAEFLRRGREHDQSKLESPEVEVFEEYTPKLRGMTYGTSEYWKCLAEMKPAIDHHNKTNRHHPEHFVHGVYGMNLFDLMEMLVDWRAAGMRHDDGDIYESLRVNRERFGMSEELYYILLRTINYLEDGHEIKHKARES